MSFLDKFVAEILALQVALYHARARLEARADSEALHDLRIAVRRIRSFASVRCAPCSDRKPRVSCRSSPGDTILGNDQDRLCR